MPASLSVGSAKPHVDARGVQGRPRPSINDFRFRPIRMDEVGNVLLCLLSNSHNFSEIVQTERIDVPILTLPIAIPTSETGVVRDSPIVVVTENRCRHVVDSEGLHRWPFHSCGSCRGLG